ncbi:hypothetical protein FACS1894167_07670 [Synergistales bacterium]|nr:hypothetical protein FACS1894167_07670 [Synergistales bacterium]
MPDFAAVLERNERWRELARAMLGSGVPQALAAIIPGEYANSFCEAYARHALCESGTGSDACKSCGMWSNGEHPDMIITGEWGKTPTIDECRDMQWQLCLKPVAAPLRLGVVPEAEGLLLPHRIAAANSLLKITEDPPPSGRLLFIASREEFLPTIRSRLWIIDFGITGEIPEDAAPLPGTPLEWASWIERTKGQKGASGTSIDDLAPVMRSWARQLCERGEFGLASSVDSAYSVARKRRVPLSMLQDAMFAILWEGIDIGKIFGDLR